MTDSDAEIMSLEITRFKNSIELNGYIKIPDSENNGEFLEDVDKEGGGGTNRNEYLVDFLNGT